MREKQVALVTGSSRGIGEAIVLELARRGYEVVINYYDSPDIDQNLVETNREQANQVLNKVKNAGGSGFVLGADVSVPQSAKQLVEETVANLGTIDVLVNNAGINKDQLMIRMSDDDWQQIIATNLNSAFYCCRAALKYMIKKRYGRIINISSVVGISGNAGQAHYAASKSGLLGLTFSIAREYGARGITANAVAPGYIQTDMTGGFTDEQSERLLGGIAVGRMGKPEDIANAVAFLASPETSYITGQLLRVDGGMSI